MLINVNVLCRGNFIEFVYLSGVVLVFFLFLFIVIKFGVMFFFIMVLYMVINLFFLFSVSLIFIGLYLFNLCNWLIKLIIFKGVVNVLCLGGELIWVLGLIFFILVILGVFLYVGKILLCLGLVFWFSFIFIIFILLSLVFFLKRIGLKLLFLFL